MTEIAADDLYARLKNVAVDELDRLKAKLTLEAKELLAMTLKDLASLTIRAMRGEDTAAEQRICEATIKNMSAAAQAAAAHAFTTVVGQVAGILGQFAGRLVGAALKG